MMGMVRVAAMIAVAIASLLISITVFMVSYFGLDVTGRIFLITLAYSIEEVVQMDGSVSLWSIATWGCVALLFYAGYTAIGYIASRSVRHQRRQMDGSLPIFRHATMRGTVQVNLDELHGAAYRVSPWSGELTILGERGNALHDKQMQTMIRLTQAENISDSAYTGYIQRAKSIPHRARRPGPKARPSLERGMPRITEPEETRYQVIEPESENRLIAPPDPPSIGNLIEKSDTNNICFATDIETGDYTYLNLYAVAHLKVLCASRQGKTNLVRSILLAARSSYDIIIIDPKNSWGAWANDARVVNGANTGDIIELLSELNRMNMERSELRGRYEEQTGLYCRSIYEIPDRSDIRPIILVMDELGRQISVASEEDFHQQYLAESTKLFSTSATQGIHAIGISQTRSGPYAKYMAPLLKNSATVSGMVHDQVDSRGVGYSGAHMLEPYQFRFEGRTISAPLVDTIERKLLSGPVAPSGPVVNSHNPLSSQLELPAPMTYDPKYVIDEEDVINGYRHNVREWMNWSNGRNFGRKAIVPVMIDELGAAGYPITRSQAYIWFNRRLVEQKYGQDWEDIDEGVKRSSKGT